MTLKTAWILEGFPRPLILLALMASSMPASAGPWETYLQSVPLQQAFVECAYSSTHPGDHNAIRLLMSPEVAGRRSVSMEFFSKSKNPVLQAGRNVQENLAPDLCRVGEEQIELDLSSSFHSRDWMVSVKSVLAKRKGFGSPFEGLAYGATGDDFTARVQKSVLFGKARLGGNPPKFTSMFCRLVSPAEFEDRLLRETLSGETEPRLVAYCEGKSLPAGQDEIDRASECLDYRLWKRMREARGESTNPRQRIRYALPGPRVVEVVE